MKVAIFRRVMDGNYNFDTILNDKEVTAGSVYEREYIQLTEWAPVEFKLFPPESIVAGQIRQIDAAEQELREKFQQKLNELAEARGKLLSLTNESAS